MEPKDIVLLSTADWDNPFWTNKQHVAVELARLGNRVFYIDSLGLRRPSVSVRDIRRIGSRLLKAVRPPRQVMDNVWVWSPLVLPWQGNLWIRCINRVLLGVGLRVWLRILRFNLDWFWTYNPLSLEFFNLNDFKASIYHCVDEIKAQPGMPVETLESSEEELAKSVDIIFATSPRLAETRKVFNPETYYLPNVADFQHFSSARSRDVTVPKELEEIPRPRLGFIGAISGYKIDFGLIRQVAQARPQWSIVLIGEVGEGDPWTDSSILAGINNIHFLGARPYKELPAYLKGFDVALLPNNINDYTDSMFPMKFFEYLASGCPVVSVNLKALQEFSGVAAIAKDSEDFIGKIEEILAGAAPLLDKRIEVAKEFTYEARTLRMISLIEEKVHANE